MPRTILFCLLLLTPLFARAADRPNVLFIILDDLKPDIGCYGHPDVLTPNIDRLASTGVLFTHAYCQQAVCAPSRASFLSGLRPDSTHIYDLATPLRSKLPDIITLPQAFKNAGYQSIALGKIYHHPTDDPQGFTEKPWRGVHDAPGNNPSGDDALNDSEKPAKRQQPSLPLDLPDSQWADGQCADHAIAKLTEFSKSKEPFFLAVGILKPHLPFVVPKKYWDLYDESKLHVADNPYPPKGVPPVALTNSGELRQYVGIPKSGPVDDPTALRLIHGYRAATSFADAQIGRILDQLDSLHLRNHTIIVLLGDHGWHLGDHGLWTKHTNFESATHAPLILSAPGFPPARTNSLVEFIDLFPTLCDLAHIPAPKTLEGKSLVPLLKDPAQPFKPAAFSQFPHNNRMGHSLTDGRYRLTRWPLLKDPTHFEYELYDHQSDPEENTNLANDPAHADVLHSLNSLFPIP